MIRVGLSTTCVDPRRPLDAFALAADLGYDGVEVMVTHDADTRDARLLRGRSRDTGTPVLSVHAPVFSSTVTTWGLDAARKLERTVELALDLDAPTVVVHPPFRFRPSWARRFDETVRELAAESGVELAVENMFAPRALGRRWRVYRDAQADAVTLDFSHAAADGADAAALAAASGARLRHVHLCDGVGGRLLDEHLAPGEGTQPVRQVLGDLAAAGWRGAVVAEVHTRHDDRAEVLAATLRFARAALSTPRVAPADARPARRGARRDTARR